MSFFSDTPWLTEQEPAAAPEDSSFERGLRSGWTGAQGQLHALAAGVAEPFGATDFAREHYKRSRELQEQAAREAPLVDRVGDIHDLRSGFDWAMGKAGQLIPAGAAMVAGNLLTRGRMPIRASTASLAPLEVGSSLQASQNDPVAAAKSPGERLATAGTVGTLSAAAQSVVPSVMGGKLLGRGVEEIAQGPFSRTLARNVAESVAGNAAAGAASDLAHQRGEIALNPDREIDWSRTGESAATGALIGAPFGVAGAAGEALHGAARAPGATLPETPPRAPAASTGLRDRFTGLFNREGRDDARMARALAGDRPVEGIAQGIDPKDFVAQNDAKATTWASGKLREWLDDAALAPETRAKYADLLSKVADPAARAEIGALALTRQARDKAEAFYAHVAGSDGAQGAKEQVQAVADAARAHIDALMAKPISQRVAETRASIENLLKRTDLTDDAKARLQDAAANIGDKTKQAWVATMSKASEIGDKISDGIKRRNIIWRMTGDKEFMDRYGSAEWKRSEDYSGARKIITDEILPVIRKNFDDMHMPFSEFADGPGLPMLADAIRLALKRIETGKEFDEFTTAFLDNFLGDETVPIMARLADALSADKQASDNAYAALGKMHDTFTGDKALQQVVVSNLADKTGVSRADVKEAVRTLKSYVSGALLMGKSPAKRDFIEKVLRAELDKTFGANTEKVLEAFRQAHEATKEADAPEVAKVEDRGADADEARATGEAEADTHLLNTDNPPEQEPTRFYGGKDKGLILSHEAHARTYGNQDSQARRLLERAREENPDRNVSFMKARDFARERGMSDEEIAKITNGAPDDYGVVVAEGQKQYGRITEEQARRMLLDTGEYARSKSRIDTDKKGITLDAYRITSETMKNMPYIDGESNPRRTARAFMEGLGSALVHFGAKIKGELPDSLVIARRNGEKMTLGDVKRMKARDPLMDTRDLASDIMDTRRLYERAMAEADIPKVKELREKLKELTRREQANAEREGIDTKGALEKLHEEMGVYEISPTDEVHLAAMEKGERLDREGDVKRYAEGLQIKHRADETAPSTKVAAKPAPVAKEATEHVPARKWDVADDAREVISGSAGFESIIDRYTKGVPDTHLGPLIGETSGRTVKGKAPSPVKMRALINAINDSKIANRRELRNANEAIDRLNKALGETLKKSPEAAYELQLKRSSLGVGEGQEASSASRKAVEQYVKDVLGEHVKVEWAKIMHAGEYEYTPGKPGGPYSAKIDPIHAIRMSVHALNPMGAAYHESLHAFFQHIRDQGNQEVMRVLHRAANTAPVMNQLRKLLKDSPEALKQIEGDMEERVAYMYQFYAQEKIKLGTATENIFGRIKDFVLRTLGIWTNDQRAAHIMDYFHEGGFKEHIGNPEAVHAELMARGRNRAAEYVKAAIKPLKEIESALIATGAERLRDTEIPALAKLADTIQPAHTGADAHDVGFIQAAANERTARLNGWIKKMRDLSEDDLFAAHEALRSGKPAASPKAAQAVKATRELLDSTYDYMKQAGVRLGDLGYGKDYFPRVWDADFISRHQPEFKAMLEKYVTSGQFNGDVNKVMSNLMARDGSELGVVSDMPGMQHTKERVLSFITSEDAAPFLQKNLMATVSSYVAQAARRAEWAKRFGDDGSGVKKLLAEARKDGATEEEITTAQNFLLGVDGTLGDKINPTARRLIGNMVVYQNVRLLPLAIFSSLIDPGGIVVRGGTVKDAFKAFTRAVSEIPRGFKKGAKDDQWYALAKDIGAIDDASLVHALGSAYTQGMVSDTARRINDTFFKWNLMEQFNTSMRVAATEAATGFIKKHATGTLSKHSARWLAELGLRPGDVVVRDGQMLVRESDFLKHGFSAEEAAKKSVQMRGALNRWIDGAVLRPNAADKPIWMNDPHFALFAHLKQFTYAFHNTILKRAWNEAEYGNFGPALALASYVPMMIASDFLKGLIQGGGEQPEWKKGWGPEDYLYSGVERAGLFGVSQFSSDFMKGVRQGGIGVDRVMGPTFEQLTEGIKTLAGREMFKTMTLHSLPANALYAHTIGLPATDPNFAE